MWSPALRARASRCTAASIRGRAKPPNPRSLLLEMVGSGSWLSDAPRRELCGATTYVRKRFLLAESGRCEWQSRIARHTPLSELRLRRGWICWRARSRLEGAYFLRGFSVVALRVVLFHGCKHCEPQNFRKAQKMRFYRGTS